MKVLVVVLEEKKGKLPPATVELVKKAVKNLGDVFPASMVYEAMWRHSELKHRIGADRGAYGITKFLVRGILLKLGYKDNCKLEYPVYVKNKEVR